jgi:subtilisin family serine protease
MSIYIVKPQQLLVETSSLEVNTSRFNNDNRLEQIATAISSRKDILKAIQDYTLDVQNHSRTKQKSKLLCSLDLLGVTIVDISEEEAQQLRQEFPNMLVIPNRPIELIRPKVPLVASHKDEINISDLWHLKAIGLEAARNNGFTGSGRKVTVAVLDTGIDETHPELNGQVAGAFTFDAKGNPQPMNPSEDTDGHGTHVAGLICGKKVGVAPETKVLNVVMIPKGSGTVADFLTAIAFAAMQPEVQIVNISAGIRGFTDEMNHAVEDLLAVGVLPVVAIGNEGRDKTRSPGNYIEVLSVGATNIDNKVAAFSSGGTMSVNSQQYKVPDVVAPGDKIYSSVMGGGYEDWSGSSMATPIVSGVAALILERHPNLSVTDLTEMIFSTCESLGETDERQGLGLVQVKAAL